MENLKLIKNQLVKLNDDYNGKKLLYLVPKVWILNIQKDLHPKFIIENPFEIYKLNTVKINNNLHNFNINTIIDKDSSKVVNVNPFLFFITLIDLILENGLQKSPNSNSNILQNKKSNSKESIYNLFVRYFSAFDHTNITLTQNQNSILFGNAKKSKKEKKVNPNDIYFEFLDIAQSFNQTINQTNDNIQETSLEYIHPEFNSNGTFLKCIGLLNYIQSLGCNIIYLLPIFEIGHFGKKGNLGSPYAIKNYYKFDENLNEKILDLTTEKQFEAYIEATKILNFKIVLEFVFRITSLDNDWAMEHPEWFYWIRTNVKFRNENEESESKYGPPIFLKRELKEIKEKIDNNDFKNLIVPHETHQNLFTPIPKKVARVDGKIFGLYENNKECTIASAFADWPPDDNQPAWEDVAYLRLYENHKFNYVAYNTVRMYDNELAKEENEVKELWNTISEIIPHYIKKYDIDGAMIDMGHALPEKLRNQIINSARYIKSNFIFWEENFNISYKSVKDGYNATLGYFFLDAQINYKVKEIINKVCNKEFEQNFFLTSENHNTIRSAYRNQNELVSDSNNIDNSNDNNDDINKNNLYSKFIYTITNFLPQINFIYNGFELGEMNPTNTGLGFNDKQILEFRNFDLPLFNSGKLNWQEIDCNFSHKQNDNYQLNIQNCSILEFIYFINDKLNSTKNKFDNTNENTNEYNTLDNYLSYPNSLIYIENIIKNEFQTKKLLFIGNFQNDKQIYNLKLNDLISFREKLENLTSLNKIFKKYSILAGNDIVDLVNKFELINSEENLENISNLENIFVEAPLNPFEFIILVMEE